MKTMDDPTNRDPFAAPRSPAGADASHEDVLRWLSSDLDGELPARDQVLLNDHLGGCPRCASVAREWRAARKLMAVDAALAARRTPVGLTERIMARLEPIAVAGAETSPTHALPLQSLQRSALLAAACLLGLLCSWLVSEPRVVSATATGPALGKDDAALERVLERWQRGLSARPSFFELALPVSR
jgi:anti-sigma factor RsiW